MTKTRSSRTNPVLRLALIRQLHVYLSVFIAPSLLFFAGTGALQTFRIPDQKQAPPLLVKLARVHKDDVFALKPAPPARRSADPSMGGRPEAGPAKVKAPPRSSMTALKWFFALASAGMISTTLLGLWMALAHSRRRWVMWIVLAAGAAAPAVLLMA